MSDIEIRYFLADKLSEYWDTVAITETEFGDIVYVATMENDPTGDAMFIVRIFSDGRCGFESREIGDYVVSPEEAIDAFNEAFYLSSKVAMSFYE